MRRLGEVVRVAQGLAVVRSPDDSYAALGTEVLDEQLTVVGTVVDVFGPVERPFVAVSPTEKTHVPGLVGTAVYAR
ncbi:H/ACA ribonucleoprotein complex subunit GAR1 [Haloarcula sp. GH36]|uniref:H/ACA ribonucleoprotein complex subunit GAR1 n=1 Tax=Haloarcula montana TaxID=3111776 RepID=UPI002D774769|nr:Gar1/Naf1 family protein [Haloarcula sp. GH36]